MRTSYHRAAVAAVVVSCGTSAVESGPRLVQPGAPGEPVRVLSVEEAVGTAPRHTRADVVFMQDMIVHHAQALVMSALAPARTTREDVLLLARRIEISQRDEIAVMQHWLAERGEPVPGASGGHAHDAAGGRQESVPGMLTGEELDRLAAATGAEFDRLFLAFMIRHHEGALEMVAELLSQHGAAQDMEVFWFASNIDTDQRDEIARMRRMLNHDRQPREREESR